MRFAAIDVAVQQAPEASDNLAESHQPSRNRVLVGSYPISVQARCVSVVTGIKTHGTKADVIVGGR